MTKLKVALAFSCAVLCCIGFTSVRSISSDSPTTNVPAQFDKLVDEYFDFYFEFHPSEATAAGFHQYDGKLEDYSRSAVDAEVVKLKAQQARFDLLDPAKLAPERRRPRVNPKHHQVAPAGARDDQDVEEGPRLLHFRSHPQHLPDHQAKLRSA